MQVEGVKAAIVNSCVFVICNYEDNEIIYRSLLFRSMVGAVYPPSVFAECTSFL
jgi:hypothetical protein